jgi:hypothetical protein
LERGCYAALRWTVSGRLGLLIYADYAPSAREAELVEAAFRREGPTSDTDAIVEAEA